MLHKMVSLTMAVVRNRGTRIPGTLQ